MSLRVCMKQYWWLLSVQPRTADGVKDEAFSRLQQLPRCQSNPHYTPPQHNCSLVRTSAIWIIFLSTADILITDHCVHQGQKCPEFLLTVCSFVSFCETVFFLSNARSLGNCDVGIGIQYLGARIIDQWQFLEESWAETKTAEIAEIVSIHNTTWDPSQ